VADPNRDEILRFSLGQRIKFALAAAIVAGIVRLLGITLRHTMSFEPNSVRPDLSDLRRKIFPFWHRCAIPAIWIFRNRDLAVMTSRSADGEYIARVIEKFGFPAVRGSSSRGGAQALRELRTMIENNRNAVFTIDGPRGPRYIAKRGPILLASMTGAPIVCFYVAVKSAWVLNSWDRFIIPKPFSRIHTHVAEQMTVPPELDEDTIEKFRLMMQERLERATRLAEEKLGVLPLDQ
jgi:lysophospholipid acyltransferase (LPLAT)-like uncharacterized protein